MEGFIGLLIVLVVVVSIGLAAMNHRATVGQWSGAAEQLGLDLQPGSMIAYPKINGVADGYRVSIYTFTSGGSNNNQRYTRYEVSFPPLGLGLSLTRQTAVGGFFRRIVGMPDIEVGDQAFDESFTVKADDPQQLLAYLTPVRRTTLGRLLATFPSLKVSDESVRVDVRRVVRDPDILVSTTRRLLGVARVLGESDPEREDASVARASGELTEALRRMRAAVEKRPDDVERRLDEIDTLAAADRSGEIADRVEELARLAPADPEVAGWTGSIAKADPPKPDSRPLIDVNEATADLLGGRQLSFAVRDKFIAGYKDGRVRWSGPVKSARAYERDHDFGEGPGVKAVVTVSMLEHDLFGSTEVDAIVEFPGSGPVPAKGDTISFEGTLSAVDPLMRNFTVRGARLI